MKLSPVHISLVLGYTADAITYVSELVTGHEPGKGAVRRRIENTRHVLKQALKYLDEIPIADEEESW